MYQMIYNYLEVAAAPINVARGAVAAADGLAGRSRPLSADRCRFRGQPGDDSGGFCRPRPTQRFDRILATRHMAESA